METRGLRCKVPAEPCNWTESPPLILSSIFSVEPVTLRMSDEALTGSNCSFRIAHLFRALKVDKLMISALHKLPESGRARMMERHRSEASRIKALALWDFPFSSCRRVFSRVVGEDLPT